MAAGSSPNLTATTSAHSPEDAVSVPWARVEGFVGQLTHDIRNGLNALELQLTFLGEITTDPEAVDEVKRLRATLQGVTRHLQAVRLVTTPVMPHVLAYPAADLFEDLRERFERLYPDAAENVSWDINVGPAVCLLVDPDLTINALLELFNNAIRFGAASIGCTTEETPPGITFILSETITAGQTISTEDWGKPLLTTRRGAYGLGLFRVRRILAAQDGTIVFHSSASQQLTTTVKLPLAAVPSRNP